LPGEGCSTEVEHRDRRGASPWRVPVRSRSSSPRHRLPRTF